MTKLRSIPFRSYTSFGRDMNLIVLSLILANIGSVVEQRFFPLYVRELGGSPTQIGLVATIAGLFIVVLSPIGGWATDRYRRVTLYAIGPVVGAVGEILMVLAPSWGWLIPGYLLAVFPGLLVGPALFGLVSDLGPNETRGSRFAYQAAGFGVCAAVGPVLGGLIYKHLGYRTFMMGQAAMLCLAGFIRSRIRDPREAVRRESGYRAPGFFTGLTGALRQMLASRQIVLFFLISGLVGFALTAAGTFTSVFMSEVAHVDQAAMGIVYSFAGLAGIAGSVASGIAADRLGRKPVMAVALFGSAVGLIWFSGARTLASLGAVWLFQGFVGSLPGPAGDAFFADVTDKDSRGTVRSVFSSLQNLVMLPAPLIGGFLYDHVAPVAPFWSGAALTLVGMLALLAWMKEPGRERGRAVEDGGAEPGAVQAED